MLWLTMAAEGLVTEMNKEERIEKREELHSMQFGAIMMISQSFIINRFMIRAVVKNPQVWRV